MTRPRLNAYLYGAKRYQVIAPVVVAERVGYPDQYVYKTALLPYDTLRTQVESLLEAGMIRELEEAE